MVYKSANCVGTDRINLATCQHKGYWHSQRDSFSSPDRAFATSSSPGCFFLRHSVLWLLVALNPVGLGLSPVLGDAADNATCLRVTMHDLLYKFADPLGKSTASGKKKALLPDAFCSIHRIPWVLGWREILWLGRVPHMGLVFIPTGIKMQKSLL